MFNGECEDVRSNDLNSSKVSLNSNYTVYADIDVEHLNGTSSCNYKLDRSMSTNTKYADLMIIDGKVISAQDIVSSILTIGSEDIKNINQLSSSNNDINSIIHNNQNTSFLLNCIHSFLHYFLHMLHLFHKSHQHHKSHKHKI